MSWILTVFVVGTCLAVPVETFGSGGRMWRPSRVADLSVDALHVDVLDPKRMYATGHPDGRIFGSTDAGASWSVVWVSPPLGKGDQSITGLSVSPHVPGRLLATVNSGGRAGGLHESLDCGRTWSEISGPWNGGPLESVHEHPVQSGFLVVGDGQDLWRLTSLGWAEVEEPEDAQELVYDPSSATTYLAGDQLYLSQDFGQTWSAASGLPDGSISDVTIDERGSVYVFVNQVGAFQSRDAGQTWRDLSIGTGSVASGHLHVLPGEPIIVLGLSGHSQFPGLYVSDSDGESWVRVRTLSVSDIAPSPSDPSTFYASTRDMVDGFLVSGIDLYARHDPATSVKPISLGHIKAQLQARSGTK